MKSSISEPSKDVWFANSVNILLKTPSLLHYNAADDASVIDMWGTVRTGKERFDAFHLIFGKIKQGTHGAPPYPLYTLFFFL